MKTKTPTNLPAMPESEAKPEVPQKFLELLKLEKIHYADFESFTKEEGQAFIKFLEAESTLKKGDERDFFLEKVAPLITPAGHENAREINHNNITRAIKEFIKERGRMPTKLEIAKKTGLSRVTVYKHLKEYKGSDLLRDQMDLYQMMAPRVVDNLFVAATNGDIKAAKIYLDSVAKLNALQGNNTTVVNTQNNYLQINNTILSQATLQQLQPETLKEIEEIIKRALEQKTA